LIGLLPRFWLQLLWAGSRGEASPSSGLMWSASHGSPGLYPPPHRWQWVAVARTMAAFFLYAVVYRWRLCSRLMGLASLMRSRALLQLAQ